MAYDQDHKLSPVDIRNLQKEKMLTMIKTDTEIGQEVRESLANHVLLHNENIGVNVLDGVVYLKGYVDRYLKKVTAAETVYKIAGARNVVNEIEIRFNGPVPADVVIFQNIRTVIDNMESLKNEPISVSVSAGRVTVTGRVTAHYQRKMIKSIVKDITGVRALRNILSIATPAFPCNNLYELEKALQRYATIDVRKLKIILDNGNVLLSGYASSITQKKEAEDIVWAFPGIALVDNRIMVNYMDNMAY